MLTIKVPLAKAEEVKQDLHQRELFEHGYKIARDKEFIYFPVKEEFDSAFEFLDKDLKASTLVKPTTLKEALKGKLPAEIVERVKTTYDQVGDIAILEIDDELKPYEQIIGETLLQTNTKAATVLAKDASHEGTFRTQKMRLVAGVDKRVALHRENGVTLEVDVEEVYFSARLSTERKRIAELVKQGEDVLVMFSGCGPYTCSLAKNTEAKAVTGIEINPKGHALAEKNIERNKLRNATTYCGDVKEVVPKLLEERKGELFDRILMPLPKSAETFLDVTLSALKPGGIIHFYAFLHKDEFSKANTWIEEACQKASKRPEFLGTTRCGQQAPYVYRICVDTRID